MELLAENDFGIEYIKGKENKVVDSLSHRKHIASISLGHTELVDKIHELQYQDYHCQRIRRELVENPNKV